MGFHHRLFHRRDNARSVIVLGRELKMDRVLFIWFGLAMFLMMAAGYAVSYP